MRRIRSATGMFTQTLLNDEGIALLSSKLTQKFQTSKKLRSIKNAPSNDQIIPTTRSRSPKKWSGWWDLNPRPLRPERSALPS